MIRDLIGRLQDAISEEAEHENWCRAELASNKKVRTDRETTIERLTSEIDETRSTIAKYAEEATKLSQELANLDQEHAELTKIRNAERAENEKTVKDAQEAQKALSQAVTVLKEFYAQAGGSFVQQRQGRHSEGRAAQEPPPVFDGAYQGMAAESGGVLGMLEVIQSDFARLESTTTADEATAQREYDDQMSKGSVMKVQLKKDIEHKNQLKQIAEQSLVDMNNDLTSAQKELVAAEAYFEKLKPSCLDAGMSVEERARRRREEIE